MSFASNRFATSSLRAIARARATTGTGACAGVRVSFQRRTYASATDAAKHAAKKGSDVPWALASLLVFGSTFIYLTAPPSKAKTHHNGGHKEESHANVAKKEEQEEAKGEEEEAPAEKEEEQQQEQSTTKSEKKEDKPEEAGGEDKEQGDEKKNDSTQSDESFTGKSTDDTKFSTAVEASKDGEVESDPKKVVKEAEKKSE